MSRPAPEFDFFPWVIFDDEETIIGIRDDAPQEAKEAYAEFMWDEFTEDGLLIV